MNFFMVNIEMLNISSDFFDCNCAIASEISERVTGDSDKLKLF